MTEMKHPAPHVSSWILSREFHSSQIRTAFVEAACPLCTLSVFPRALLPLILKSFMRLSLGSSPKGKASCGCELISTLVLPLLRCFPLQSGDTTILKLKGVRSGPRNNVKQLTLTCHFVCESPFPYIFLKLLSQLSW